MEVGVQKITSMNERNRWDNLEALSLDEIKGLSRMIIKESNYGRNFSLSKKRKQLFKSIHLLM